MAKLHRSRPSTISDNAPSSLSSFSNHPPPHAAGSNLGSWYHPSWGHSYSGSYTQAMSSAISRTMSYASSHADSSPKQRVGSSYIDENQVMRRPATGLNPRQQRSAYVNGCSSTWSSYEPVPAPRTDNERYWAYRAITAETKLAEQKGLRTDELDRMKEDLRRESLVDAAHKYHEDRVLKLERLAIGLISAIMLITLILLFRQTGRSEDKHSKRAFRPQFTIPILSPFTSIIEHEESKMSFRTTAVFLIVLGCLAYAMLRHWLHRRPRL